MGHRRRRPGLVCDYWCVLHHGPQEIRRGAAAAKPLPATVARPAFPAPRRLARPRCTRPVMDTPRQGAPAADQAPAPCRLCFRRATAMSVIDLDNNATTPLLPAVWEAMRPFYTEVHGNPASAHRVGR